MLLLTFCFQNVTRANEETFDAQIFSQTSKDVWFFLKMDQSRPLFVYFCSFLITISIIQTEKSINSVIGIQTRGCRKVGADEYAA